MARLSFVPNPKKTNKNGSRTIMVRLSIGTTTRYYSTDYSAKPHQWDINGQQFKGSHKYLNDSLQVYKAKVTKIFHKLLEENTLTFDRFKIALTGNIKKVMVQEYIQGLIVDMKAMDRLGNAKVYGELLALLSKYSKAMVFEDINIAFLRRLESNLRRRGVGGNTISRHMRTLRATFNRAIADELVNVAVYPFKNPTTNPRGFNIGALEVVPEKRALSEADLQKIITYQPGSEREKLAKDIFVISLYLQGISFSDLARLKHDNIRDGRLEYRRQKTRNKARISVQITQVVQDIIDKYKDATSPYLMPVLSHFHKSEQQKINRIHKVLGQCNQGLKSIAKEVGIEGGISTYTARHTWATILKRKGVSVGIISQGLGHTSEATTQAYLDSFENKAVDDANLLLP